MQPINNFIKTIMLEDLENKKVTEIITRFPPEPNAYLHIGHARAIFTNFLLAKEFSGKTNLRFDDTNPAKEEQEYVDAIIENLEWLGCHPDQILFGSDYFDETYEKALILIRKGLAYVCDLSKEEMQIYRGTLTEAGKDSPYRNRSIEENLDLFRRMRDGEFKDGEKVLRAKIDMSHPNMNMRDPVIYRIMHIAHHRQGNKWCIYPMYDFAHPLQDSFENITHSLCSLEYDNHRILYDWFIDNCDVKHIPHQYEFGRLNIAGMIMSKRYLRLLVEKNLVEGYDDPRMPTLVGLRRRGFTPEAIKNFILDTGLSRTNSTTSYEMLEHFLREDLKLKTTRKMAVINPLKVTITNYPEHKIEYLGAENNSENPSLGDREIAFGREIYIEKDDFIEEKPNKKWKRLALGVEVRLMNAYFITCTKVIKNESGEIIAIEATYDPKTKSGSGFDERKPNGTIHFVEKTTALKARFNYYDKLLDETLDEELPITERINQNSVKSYSGYVESSLKNTTKLDRYQFIRQGYFVTDEKDDALVFNCICELKSSFQ